MPKLTVASLNEKQTALCEKTNTIESSLTATYMSLLTSIVESHGIAEMIGREHMSLAGSAVDVVYKAKVKLGYPKSDKARERVRCLCSPIWKLFIAPCISATDEGFEYDAEKLVSFHAKVKSGELSICKAKKGSGGGGSTGTMTKDAAFLSWFNAMGEAGQERFKKTATAKAIVKALTS